MLISNFQLMNYLLRYSFNFPKLTHGCYVLRKHQTVEDGSKRMNFKDRTRLFDMGT